MTPRAESRADAKLDWPTITESEFERQRAEFAQVLAPRESRNRRPITKRPGIIRRFFNWFFE